jgi:BirA family biotin operon repressor/biotin-[acetyl-CoA-carboxylase] ligase
MKLLEIENPFGGPVYHEETLSGTFDAARGLAERNEPHGTVISADFQEAGRGRQNRSWTADRGKNLLFTILLRYGGVSSIPEALTLKTGLAVSLALEDLVPSLAGSVQVKWPNDVMINSRKAAGILIEGDGKNIFIGVGVNVLQTEFPKECRSRAGSVIQFFPGLTENAKFILLEKILYRLYEEIGPSQKPRRFRDAAPASHDRQPAMIWRERLLKRLYKRSEIVTFVDGGADSGRLVKGTLSGIGPNGELLLVPRGETKERAFVTGELQVYEPAEKS